MIPVDLSANVRVRCMIRTDPGSRSMGSDPGAIFGIHGHVWRQGPIAISQPSLPSELRCHISGTVTVTC